MTTGGISGASGGAGGGSGLTGSGLASSGGAPGAGGASTGGSVGRGGTPGTGGVATGGTSPGGAPGSGGSSTGGVTAKGGAPGTGGTATAGGTSNGGAAGAATGGTSGASGSGGGGGAGAPSTCPKATPLTGGKQYCSNSTGNINGGYSYELWAEGSGSGCMTVYSKDATFSANWNNVEDLLARVGLSFDRTRKHAQIGDLVANFAETKTGSNGLVYVGIYGWTVNPLKEYYILDDWGEIKPAGTASDGTPRTSVGTITVDGDTYDVWKKLRENKPAITGPNETFEQYFSIRRNARQCGEISISEHFSKWEELGLELGNLTEAKILVEAQDSSGTIEFTTATVVVK